MRLALLASLLVSAAIAAPPELTIPPDLKPVNGYVRFTPTTTAKSVLYVALDDAFPFPSEELKDSRRFVLPVQGLKDGAYRFVAVGSLNDEQTATPFVITIGKKPADPVKPDPVLPPATKRHYMLVRPAGPIDRNSAVEKSLALPAWGEVKAAGHTVADLPFDQLTPKARDKFAGQPLPFLLRWQYSGEQIVLPDDAVAGAVPTTDEAIRGLLK